MRKTLRSVHRLPGAICAFGNPREPVASRTGRPLGPFALTDQTLAPVSQKACPEARSWLLRAKGERRLAAPKIGGEARDKKESIPQAEMGGTKDPIRKA